MTARTPAQVLHEARQADSRDKRARVLATVADMESRHEPVTFTAVARAAGVSNWLVYATGIRERIEQARERQKALPRHELEMGRQASAGAMQTDLALAREEIKALRGERDQLKAAGAATMIVDTGCHAVMASVVDLCSKATGAR